MTGAHNKSIPRFLMMLMIWIIVSGPVSGGAETTIAYVNGDSISTEMLEHELMRMHTSQTQTIHRDDFRLDRLVQKLIDNQLLLQEARAIGLEQDSAIRKQVDTYRETLAYRAFLDDITPDTLTATDAEIRELFEHNFQRFELRLICVNDSSLANLLADSIRLGVPMKRLAQTYSVDRYAKAGGAAGIYALADTPPGLQPYLLESKVGEIIGPLYLWRLFALIRVEAHLPPDTAKLDSLRSRLENEIINQKQREARRDSLKELYDEISIVVDSSIVDSLPGRMRQGLPGSNRPVITVAHTRTVTEKELRNKYMFHVVGQKDRKAEEILADVINEEIGILLLKEAAARHGYLDLSSLAEPVRAFEDSLLLAAYLDEIASAGAEVSSEEVKAYYESHQDDYRLPPRVKIATLTRETLAEAEEDYKELQEGADFAWLARRHVSGIRRRRHLDFGRQRQT